MRQFIVFVSAIAITLFVCTNADAEVRRLCLPSLEASASGKKCTKHFDQLNALLGKAFMTKKLDQPPMKLDYGRNVRMMKQHLKRSNNEARDAACAAYLVYFCRPWKQKKAGRLVRVGSVFKFNVFPVQQRFSFSRFRKSPLIRKPKRMMKGFVRAGKQGSYFRNMLSGKRLKKALTAAFSPARTCKTHADCNAGTSINMMCKAGKCKLTNCSQSDSIGDMKCAADMHCSKDRHCKLRRANGASCDRDRVCRSGNCNAGSCADGRTPQSPPRIVSAQKPGKLKEFGSVCDRNDPCGGPSSFLQCDLKVMRCKVKRGKFCTRTTKCMTGDYCNKSGASNDGQCKERVAEGGACAWDAYSFNVCKAGLKCINKKCSKPQNSPSTPSTKPDDNSSHVAGGMRRDLKRTPKGILKKVTASVSVAGAGILDVSNILRHTEGVLVEVQVMPRQFPLGGYFRTLLGTRLNDPKMHVTVEFGLVYKLINPDESMHGLFLSAGFHYRGVNVVHAAYHEVTRVGIVGDIVYDLLLFNWGDTYSVSLRFSGGFGIMERTLGPYEKVLQLDLRFSCGVTFRM